MNQKLNTTEKKLKFHCSTCQTTWQLLVIRTDCQTNENTKCLNNCLQKRQTLLINYCQEQIILDLTKQEEAKDNKEKMITDWLNQIRKQNNK